MNATIRFHHHLESLGIPVAGVSGEDATARIDFLPEATEDQRTTALAARGTFPWASPEEDRRHQAALAYDRSYAAFAQALKEQFPQLDLTRLREDFQRLQGSA